MTFGVAFGHRVRQVREANGQTAAEVASLATHFGLGWDRSTVTRVELGQRQVTAAELLVLPVLYGVSVADLLPTEPCQLTHDVSAAPDVMRAALTDVPGLNDYESPRVREVITAGLDAMAKIASSVQKRYPDVPGMLLLDANRHRKDVVVVKAAQRLGADPFDVAVAALQLWGHDLTTERDRRVGTSDSLRARQARRGHVTRALTDELTPVIAELQAQRKGGRRGKR